MQVGNWRYLSLREARLTFLFWFKEVGYSLGIYWIAFATLLSIIFPSPPLSKPRRLELRIRGEEREGRERGEGGRGRRVSCNTTFSVQVRRGVRRSSTLCSGEDWRPPPLSGLASPPPHYQLLGRGTGGSNPGLIIIIFIIITFIIIIIISYIFHRSTRRDFITKTSSITVLVI